MTLNSLKFQIGIALSCIIYASIGRHDWGYQSIAVFYSCLLPFTYFICARAGKAVKARYQIPEQEFLIILGIMTAWYGGYHCMFDLLDQKLAASLIAWSSPILSIFLCSIAATFTDESESEL